MFVGPAAVILVVMMAYPTIQTIRMSVSEVSLPGFELQFNGIRNFIYAFNQAEFNTVVKNTFLWLAGTVVLRFAVGFIAALTMNTELPGLRVFQVIALIPWTIPQIVAANTWRWVFQSDYGLLNALLNSIGLGSLAHPWLGDSATALGAIMVASIWTGFPFIMLMLLAGLKAIPNELYDAAKVDGASMRQRFLYITIPSLKGIITIMLMLETIWALNTFDLIFVMTGGGPGSASEVFGLFIYRLGFRSFQFGPASAMGVLLLVFALMFMLVYLPLMNRKKGK